MTSWNPEGRFTRIKDHPIDIKTITELACAREEGMPHIEHDDDSRTVTSEFSLKCQRAIDNVKSYEDTVTELSNSDKGSDYFESDSEGENILEEDPIEDDPDPIIPLIQAKDVVVLPEPEGELSTVIQEARFERMMDPDKKEDEGMGVAVAAAAVFLVLAYSMS